MARMRVRIVNFDNSSKKNIPKVRAKLESEAGVILTCEPNGCFVLEFTRFNDRTTEIMANILKKNGFEFYYPDSDYSPNWSEFEPINGCNCSMCKTARNFIAAQKKG